MIRKFFIVAFFFSCANLFAAVMESGNKTLFILLNTISDSQSSQADGSCWNPNLKEYIETNIVANKGLVYCAEYNSLINSPAVFAKEFATNEDAILVKALQNWYDNTDDAKIIDLKTKGNNLAKIKALRPDLVPLKYVVIANGASGLAVREYIQSKDYQGEISNVLFFNTPHEGTGFADQALFSVDGFKYIEKKQSAKSLSALIPLALTAYIVGGIDQLRDVMISLAKDAVIGLATDYASDASESLKENYFSKVSPNSKSLWYLAQDADEDDPLYQKIMNKNDGIKNAASENLGSIQLLNSFSKNNDFDHPLYNVAYSEGFPTIGNGRRTLSDYYDVDKNHISQAQLKRVLADSLTATLKRNGLSVDKEEVKEDIQSLAGELVDGEISTKAKEIADDLIKNCGELNENVMGVLKDEKLKTLVGGLSDLRSMKWNKDDIPGNILKIISFVEKFIPEEYKSQIYSSFIDKLSPEVKDFATKYGKCVVSGETLKDCAKLGMKTAAQNLANYSLNFFDSGTFDVPSYSAIGESVVAFKKSATQRFGYQLDEIVENNKEQFKDLYSYQEHLNNLGEFEQTRVIVDVALDAGCSILENSGVAAAYGKICRAAEFAVNIGMMAESAVMIKRVATNAKNLEKTRDIALWAAQNRTKEIEFTNKSKSLHSDIDEMLYAAPRISIASVLQKVDGQTDSIIPLMFSIECLAGNQEIYDYTTMSAECNQQAVEDPQNAKELYPLAIASNKIINNHTGNDMKTLPVKYVNYENGKKLYGRTNYASLEQFVTHDYIREFRFLIDDITPDSLRKIVVYFNDKVTLAYERNNDATWSLYYNNKIVNQKISNPVDKYGNFILRPEPILEKEGTKLAAAEQGGFNVVNLYVENNLGLSDGRQFTFFFQETDPLIEEGWPASYETVSRMDEAFISFNELKFDLKVTSGMLKIHKVGEDDKNDYTTNLILNYNDSTGITTLTADLEEFSNSLSEGDYQLDWEIEIFDTKISKTNHDKYAYLVHVDTTAPKVDWIVSNRILKGAKSDGVWATVKSLDATADLSVRAIRAFVVGNENNKDTIKLYSNVRSSEYYYYMDWPDSVVNINGKATLHVQAYDFSNPNKEFYQKLLNISPKNTDSLWAVVLDAQGKFVKGINGIDDSVTIWIDKNAPQIINNSIKLTIASDSISDGIDFKKKTTEKYLLNNKDTLKVSFEAKEEFLLGVDSAEVTTSLIFKNLLDGKERVFYHDSIIKNPTFKYSFSEPEANRLADGIYSLTIELKDASGNVSDEKIIERLVVDRTSPVVAQIYTGALAFVSQSDLGNITGYVEQTRDIETNKSDLACYSKINSEGSSTNWVFVENETKSKASNEEVSLSYALRNVVADSDLPNGTWFVHMRCYDAAGNVGENVDYFGMGARYPQITNPGDTLNTMYYGKVIVKGIAPNPVVRNGDDNLADFKIEYKKHEDDDSKWEQDSITYLVKGVHVEERDLAVWRIPKDVSGIYDLKLSVRGCKDDNLCSWESTIAQVPVHKKLIDSITPQPTINFVHIPEKQNPGKMDTISFELKGFADTAKWTAKVSIRVQSPLDDSKMVSAAEHEIKTIRVSPFEGKPEKNNDGLSVWKNGNVWNIKWVGKATGVNNGSGSVEPTLRVKYLKDNFKILDGSFASNDTNTVTRINALNVDGMIVPSFDEIVTWNLNGNDLLIQVQTDSAFTIDLSTVENSDTLIFCGTSSLHANEISSASVGNGILYVHPDQYVVKIPFNALTATKLYPGGENVEMDVYAYNNRNYNQVISDHRDWNLSLEASALQTTMPDSGEFFIGIGDTTDELGATLAKQNLGYTFGLTGQAAMVEAWVEDSNGKRIRTLKEKSKTIAGSDYQAYSLSWDGMTDENFVAAQPGYYKIKVYAYDKDDNVISELSYDFELKFSNTLVEAPYADDGKVYAELSMDEAIEDATGLRFAGNPDYLLRVNANMQTLPTEDQQFSYKWEWDPNNEGVQYPYMYKKFRPSIGIWRQRDEFPVTVVTLLITHAYNLDSWRNPLWGDKGCDAEDQSLTYLIKIDTLTFKKSVSERTIDFVFESPNKSITGYDKNSDDEMPYPIYASVKILPRGKYAELKAQFFDNIDSVKGDIPDRWNGHWWSNNIWNVNTFNNEANEKHLRNFMSNWENTPVYWEGRTSAFQYNTVQPQILTQNASENLCTPQTEFESNPNEAVCDDNEKNIKEKIYNPNKYIFSKAYVEGINNGTFIKKKHPGGIGKCGHSASAKTLSGRIHLSINSDYWDIDNSKWGENNLANRFVRFDPANKTLFNKSGYLYLNDNTVMGGHILNKHNGTDWENCIDGEDCFVTAFETLYMPMLNNESNPLLFADETAIQNFKNSRYKVHFFGRNDNFNANYIAMIVQGSTNIVIDSIESEYDSYITPKIIHEKYDINPLDIGFWVAPQISLNKAFHQDNRVKVSYPYMESSAKFKDEMKKSCLDGFRCYNGLASRLHYGIGDWDENYWNEIYLTKNKKGEKVVNNFVRAFLSKINLFDVDYIIPNPNNAMAISKKITVDSKKDYFDNQWIIHPDTLTKFHDSNSGVIQPSGTFKPSILISNGKKSPWQVSENPDPEKKGQWIIHYAGAEYKPVLNYIFSKDRTQNIQRDNVEHSVSFDAILAQNNKDTILTSVWTKNLTLSNPMVFRRDTVVHKDDVIDEKILMQHQYLEARDKEISIEKNGYFEIIKRSNTAFDTRIDEVATIRGRVPGENVNWKLFYSKNGMIFPAATGIQTNEQTATPYNILDYIDLNRLQGNTSFFLTYGGKNNATYFRQLDVHIGTLVTPNDSMEVHSMYGNISVNFPAHSWGEKNVDVTVRTIGPEDYNLTAFDGIDVIGPVLEVLPSHVFPEDESLRPEIHMVVMRSEIEDKDASNLRIYKPDVEKGMLIPLTTSTHKFKGTEECETDCNGKWDRVLLKAKTATFSKFLVMDAEKASHVVLKDSLSTEKGELICHEMSTNPLWAGTANGWLELPYPCSGKSNYTIQLRSGSSIAAEHQGKTTDPIIWNARNNEISLKDSIYNTRLYFFGQDGKDVEVRSPAVKIDSLAPTFANDIDITVTESSTSRNIQVDATVQDSGSGVAKTKFDLYFGGRLLQSRTVLADSVMSEIFTIARPELYNCLGCKATITVTTEDYGHNFARATLNTEPLYPYPASLVLWYPLAEGAGDKGIEATGTGMDLNLTTISKPWWTTQRLHLYGNDYATTKSNMVQGDSAMPFSIEMKVSVGYKLGSIFSWTSPKPWTIGIIAGRYYYLETENGRTIFSTKASVIAQDHVVFTVDGNQVQLFKNGELKETKTIKNELVWVGGGRPVVGKNKDVAISGYVSDIRLYTSVLTSSQVSSLYMDNLDLDDGDVYVVRATTLDHSGLVTDQSCAIAGKSYLRQQTPATSAGHIVWNVDIKADNYNAYLLMKSNASEKARVEVLVNGVSKGIREMKSTGVWESQKIDNLTVDLGSGSNTIAIRPIGNVGIAGIALVSVTKSIEANQVDYGEGTWKAPAPQVAVKMMYDNVNDVTWTRPRIQLTNLTSNSFIGAKIRYYYKGEGENVQAVSFYPSSPMRIAPDDGSIYYGELTLTDAIQPYGTVYYGNGPQIGLHRTDYYFPWNILDDPSYVSGAENGYVEGTGIAVLDENGTLLNDWACFDADGPATNSRKSAIAYAKDSRYGSNQSSNITMYVQNSGTVAIDGFESRYYYRNGDVENSVDVYNNQFAKQSVVQAGGNLNYVSFVYKDVVLNPGEKSDFGNGVQFELHLPNWLNSYNASDDPSNHGLNEAMFAQADSILVLDLNGNLLWGSVPQPRFSSEYEYEGTNEDLIHVEGNVIYVNVPEKAYYTLETVNAAGMPLVRLFNGTLSEGEHSISVENKTFNPGSYLVLRKGTEILSWKLFK